MRTNQPKKNKASSGCETPARFVVVHLAEQAETTSSKLPPCYFFSKKEENSWRHTQEVLQVEINQEQFCRGGGGSEEEEEFTWIYQTILSWKLCKVLLQPLLHKNTPVHSEAS